MFAARACSSTNLWIQSSHINCFLVLFLFLSRSWSALTSINFFFSFEIPNFKQIISCIDPQVCNHKICFLKVISYSEMCGDNTNCFVGGFDNIKLNCCCIQVFLVFLVLVHRASLLAHFSLFFFSSLISKSHIVRVFIIIKWCQYHWKKKKKESNFVICFPLFLKYWMLICCPPWHPDTTQHQEALWAKNRVTFFMRAIWPSIFKFVLVGLAHLYSPWVSIGKNQGEDCLTEYQEGAEFEVKWYHSLFNPNLFS